MNERSIGVYEMSHEGGVKFDYFICSVAGALFAYIAQTFVPQKLDNVFSILQMVSLLILAVSFYAGIRRIQYHNAMLRCNHKMLSASEDARKLDALLLSPQNSFENRATGKIESRQQVEQQRLIFLEDSRHWEQLAHQADKKCACRGKVQVNCLLLGFLTIFASKILQPYAEGFSLTPNSKLQPNQAVTQSERALTNQTDSLIQPK